MSRNISISLVLCVLVPVLLSAQTIVPGGDVYGTWPASGSPYLVEGEITVPAGYTLTIEPAVEVNFQGHYKFIVNGYLEAVGTEMDSILFTAADSSVGWHSIRFIDAPDTSSLSYCIVQYGKAIGSTLSDSCGGGIYCENSNVSISDCQIFNNTAYLTGGGLIFREGSEVNMTRCTVMDNQAELYAAGVLITSGSVVTITDCEIAFNTTYQGAGLYIVESDATVTGCDIHDNSGSDGGAGGIVAASWNNNTNVSFSNCTITSNQSTGPAGGIWFAQYGFQVIVTMQNCVVTSNYCTSVGGGIYNQYCDQLTLDQCTISENTAERGGGVNCKSGGTMELQSCTIDGNITTTYAGGGLRCYEGATVTLVDCEITNNTSATNSGGVNCNSGSTVNLLSCTITGNVAGTDFAGGLRCSNATMTLDDCLVSNNTAAGNGGGIYGHDGANVIVGNTTFLENFAGYYGGGLMTDGSSFNLEHCVVSGNTASFGGAMYIYEAAPEIENTIVEGNFGNVGVYFTNSPDARLQYSDFYNNEGGDFAGNVPTGLGVITGVNVNGDPCDDFGNIFEDPEFVYPTQGDYRLSWGSPCIDAGLGMDPDATIADMGAFFYDQSIPQRILMTPFATPIEIPETGGSFDYNIQVTNIDPAALNVNAWCDVTLPSGGIYGPTLGPVNIDVPSEFTIGRDRTQSVPAGAPAGMYTYNAYAVAGPDTSFDSFTFVKLGTDGMDGMAGWFNTGESFDELIDFEAAIPLTYSLGQNYPNPFNPVTTIRYGLPEAAEVNLAVYDVAGRLVATLVDGWRDAGAHQVTFDGSALASGIYFYRFTAGQHEASGKMVLMK